jgi:hypothetical protein
MGLQLHNAPRCAHTQTNAPTLASNLADPQFRGVTPQPRQRKCRRHRRSTHHDDDNVVFLMLMLNVRCAPTTPARSNSNNKASPLPSVHFPPFRPFFSSLSLFPSLLVFLLSLRFFRPPSPSLFFSSPPFSFRSLSSLSFFLAPVFDPLHSCCCAWFPLCSPPNLLSPSALWAIGK